MIAVTHYTNPFQPATDRLEFSVEGPTTIQSIIEECRISLQLPTVALVDSTPVLRADWHSLIVKDGQAVYFTSLMQGGGGEGGSNPVRVVLSIALIVAGAMGVPGAAQVGASMLIGEVVAELLPAPKAPEARSGEASSPTYSLNSAGNRARLGQPIPVAYGRNKIYPDLLARAYVTYEDNEQYLHQLFCLGHGQMKVDALYLEDTPFANFVSWGTPQWESSAIGLEVSTGWSDPVYLQPVGSNNFDTFGGIVSVEFSAPQGLYDTEEVESGGGDGAGDHGGGDGRDGDRGGGGVGGF